MNNPDIGYWTVVHMFTGFLVGLVLDRFFETTYLFMFVIHTIWEYLEHILYKASGKKLYQESISNKVFDTIAFLVGYFIYRQVKQKLHCKSAGIELHTLLFEYVK